MVNLRELTEQSGLWGKKDRRAGPLEIIESDVSPAEFKAAVAAEPGPLSATAVDRLVERVTDSSRALDAAVLSAVLSKIGDNNSLSAHQATSLLHAALRLGHGDSACLRALATHFEERPEAIQQMDASSAAFLISSLAKHHIEDSSVYLHAGNRLLGQLRTLDQSDVVETLTSLAAVRYRHEALIEQLARWFSSWIDLHTLNLPPILSAFAELDPGNHLFFSKVLKRVSDDFASYKLEYLLEMAASLSELPPQSAVKGFAQLLSREIRRRNPGPLSWKLYSLGMSFFGRHGFLDTPPIELDGEIRSFLKRAPTEDLIRCATGLHRFKLLEDDLFQEIEQVAIPRLHKLPPAQVVSLAALGSELEKKSPWLFEAAGGHALAHFDSYRDPELIELLYTLARARVDIPELAGRVAARCINALSRLPFRSRAHLLWSLAALWRPAPELFARAAGILLSRELVGWDWAAVLWAYALLSAEELSKVWHNTFKGRNVEGFVDESLLQIHQASLGIGLTVPEPFAAAIQEELDRMRTNPPALNRFECEVAAAFRAQGFKCQEQVFLQGYFIDVVVEHGGLWAVECDGVQFHSSAGSRRALGRDRYRDHILEMEGYRVARITSDEWSTVGIWERQAFVMRKLGLGRM